MRTVFASIALANASILVEHVSCTNESRALDIVDSIFSIYKSIATSTWHYEVVDREHKAMPSRTSSLSRFVYACTFYSTTHTSNMNIFRHSGRVSYSTIVLIQRQKYVLQRFLQYSFATKFENLEPPFANPCDPLLSTTRLLLHTLNVFYSKVLTRVSSSIVLKARSSHNEHSRIFVRAQIVAIDERASIWNFGATSKAHPEAAH